MTIAVGSTLTASPTAPAAGPDAAPDPSKTPATQSPSAAAIPTGAPTLADSTLGSLVAQQAVASAPLDLKGRDLRQTDLKSLDLKGADLRGANLSGLDLSGLDFSGANLDGADLAGATLTNANLTNVSAQGANLSQATVVNSTMDGADFTKANFNGAYIGNHDASTLHTTDTDQQIAQKVTNVRLDGASFQGATIQRVNFIGVSAVGANFSGLTANVAGFTNGNLRNADFDHLGGATIGFHDSDLSGAAFTNMSDATGKGFGRANLTGATFAGSSLDHTSFSQTTVSHADLTGVIRTANNANFGDTDLSNVDFSGFTFDHTTFDDQRGIGANGQPNPVTAQSATVRGANFSGATFNAVQFSNAHLTGGDFTGATFTHTVFQAGDPGPLANTPGIEYGQNVSAETWAAMGYPPSRSAPVSETTSSSIARNGSAGGTAKVPAINTTDNPTVVQWKQLASVLADGSNASLEDKVNAYIGMTKVFLQANATGALSGLSPADAAALDDVWHNSQVSQQISKAADDLNAKGMSLVGQIKTVNVAGVLNADFKAMSPVQQKMVYAGTASPTQYSFDQFAAEMQRSSDYEAQAMADDAKPAAAGSGAAKTAAGQSADTTDAGQGAGAAQALKTLTTPKFGVTLADVALSMLRTASAAMAKADATAKADASAAAAHPDVHTRFAARPVHIVGDAVNTSA